MYELNFITDLVEERLVKGKFRWLANFKEIRKDYKIDEFTFPIYATGGLEEKGFFLSKIFSTFVTPKYKIHFLFYTSPEMDTSSLRKLIISCKNKFVDDDWIFIGLVQNKPFEKSLKDAIESIADNRVGVAAYSLASHNEVSSKNVLGKALQKQLRLTEAKFEAFDLPDYLKSVTLVFFLGVLMLIAVAFGGFPAVIQPLSLLILALFAFVIGHQLYKKRYHVTLTLNPNGFEIREGTAVTNGKWSDFTDLTIHVTPNYETYIRLFSKERTLDLPVSRIGVSRKDTYNAIKELVKRK